MAEFVTLREAVAELVTDGASVALDKGLFALRTAHF